MTKTKQDKEDYLNTLYSEEYTEEEAVDNFIYMTNRDRGKTTTEAHIRRSYWNGTLGTLLRKLDPIAFELA